MPNSSKHFLSLSFRKLPYKQVIMAMRIEARMPTQFLLPSVAVHGPNPVNLIDITLGMLLILEIKQLPLLLGNNVFGNIHRQKIRITR